MAGLSIWSVVYGLTTGEIKVVMGQKYNQPYVDKLEMKSAD